MADAPDPLEPSRVEVEVGPTVAGRVARWMERARILRGHVEGARADHASVDVGFDVIERDSSIGGALLAGALAYRLFVWLLPTALLFVSGLGLYADTVDKSSEEVVSETGLQGLIASQIAETASGGASVIVFFVMIPAVLYATYALYRAVAKVHAIVWLGSGRGVRITATGAAFFGGALIVQPLAVELVSWIRRADQLGGLLALAVHIALIGGIWLVVSTQLPRGDARWPSLIPGSALFAVGLLFINVFNVYITTRLVEGRADTYGALGVATALLFSLVLVGRLVIVSAELNASLWHRRAGQDSPG